MAKRPKTTAGNGGDGRTLKPDDNRAAIEEAEIVQFLSFLSKITKQKVEIDKRRAYLKEATTDQTELFRLANAAGFPRWQVEERLAEIARGAAKDHEYEVKRIRQRRALMMSEGATQSDLPLEVQDENRWRSEGYLAYHRNEACEAPKGCPERMVQLFLRGWHDAETATVMALGQTGGTGQASAPPDGDRDEDHMFPRKSVVAGYMTHQLEESGLWIVELPDQSELPDEYPSEREAWEAADAHFAVHPADDFEAKPEELAAQTQRQAVVGDREGEAV